MFRAVHGDDWPWFVGVLPQLAAAQEFTLRVLAWQNTEDGSRGRNAPKQWPRPGVVDENERRLGGGNDSLPIDQMDAFLRRFQ